MFQRPRIVWVSAFGMCDASWLNAAFRTSSWGICCASTRPRSTTGWIALELTRSIQATPHFVPHFPLVTRHPSGVARPASSRLSMRSIRSFPTCSSSSSAPT